MLLPCTKLLSDFVSPRIAVFPLPAACQDLLTTHKIAELTLLSWLFMRQIFYLLPVALHEKIK
jgi:hypothetical protein